MLELGMQDSAGPFPDGRSQALYRRALADTWRADEALDWSRLSFERLSSPIRTAMATVYSDVLYAEAFGVGVTARMAELAPEGWQRDFASMQVRDEARHTDFFTRVLDRLGGNQSESRELASLSAELADIHDYVELMLHGQIIETAARVIFVGNGQRTLSRMAQGVRLPGSEAVSTLVQSVVDLIGRDESRHIAFGLHVLRMWLAQCDAAQRHALERRALVSARLMYGAFARRAPAFASLGIPAADMLARTWHALHTQLGRVELDIGQAPAL